jgi:hypothetical protein
LIIDDEESNQKQCKVVTGLTDDEEEAEEQPLEHRQKTQASPRTSMTSQANTPTRTPMPPQAPSPLRASTPPRVPTPPRAVTPPQAPTSPQEATLPRVLTPPQVTTLAQTVTPSMGRIGSAVPMRVQVGWSRRVATRWLVLVLWGARARAVTCSKSRSGTQICK